MESGIMPVKHLLANNTWAFALCKFFSVGKRNLRSMLEKRPGNTEKNVSYLFIEQDRGASSHSRGPVVQGAGRRYIQDRDFSYPEPGNGKNDFSGHEQQVFLLV